MSRIKKIKPDEFATRMQELITELNGDVEGFHSEADELLCNTLNSLGYTEGIAAFRAATKWYA